MPRRQYLGGAVPTRLNVNINNSVTSFDINNVTKWPSGGANGPFNFTLDPGTPTEEHCTAASRTGNTLTGVLRAQDNTDPQPHNVGLDGTVRHGWFGLDADDANRHIYTVHDDHSGIYMRNDGTRHDVQARHQANTTIPVGVPSGLTVGGSNVEGISTSLPRLDHAHAVTRGTPVSVGTAIAAGASGQFADATHVHDISVAAQTAIAPTGAVWMWMTGAAPAGTILLQGQTVSRTGANAALFALWGTTFGAGDGSTTFGLPDFRQVFPLGQAAAGTGSAALGTRGGNIDHTHPLDSSSSGALIYLTTTGNNIRMLRKTVSSYTTTHEVSNSLTVIGGTSGNTPAAQLTGNTDIANPPFIIVNYIVKL